MLARDCFTACNVSLFLPMSNPSSLAINSSVVLFFWSSFNVSNNFALARAAMIVSRQLLNMVNIRFHSLIRISITSLCPPFPDLHFPFGCSPLEFVSFVGPCAQCVARSDHIHPQHHCSAFGGL